ncbi:hypothetical protein LB505_011184 [Fusarium chuoi]|nr:hypothetical protein LB505_011184 [Fusarium chuoi]
MAASMTGEQIQALADALEPLTPKNLGPAVQGFAIAFGVISVIVVCLRIYVRAGLSGVSPRLLGFEDYLAVLATRATESVLAMRIFPTRCTLFAPWSTKPTGSFYTLFHRLLLNALSALRVYASIVGSELFSQYASTCPSWSSRPFWRWHSCSPTANRSMRHGIQLCVLQSPEPPSMFC